MTAEEIGIDERHRHREYDAAGEANMATFQRHRHVAPCHDADLSFEGCDEKIWSFA